jgi:uncharacterized protein (TIGR00159 family)
MKLFDLGFLALEVRDLIDITLVAFLLYQLYRLLKGSLALNIMLGLASIYMIWIVVEAFQLRLLSTILGQFIQVGVISLIILFQPEIRRFLLLLGKNAAIRNNRYLKKLFDGNVLNNEKAEKPLIELAQACASLSQEKTGALVVIARTSELQFFANTGTILDALIFRRTLETIFAKNSPLHDGAVIIASGKIKAASCVLPVSDNPDLDPKLGLRHRSAVGISEHSDAVVVVVSEETGLISIAKEGKLKTLETADELMHFLRVEIGQL